MAGALWFLAGATTVVALFSAFAAVERGPGSARMDELNTRALARAVCDNVSRTTPNFAPPPSRAIKCLLCAIAVAIVVLPIVVAMVASP
ncbi:hypothetical protein BGP89_11250 [Luteimonas sp. JM171]|uniref:hypothetical protein n=1 Tax=Luteimonas sp. JM171 TaxID=1896164 RepID=UPI000858682B|nr:hypothetical protein [Luteimonas sp. JM171]AOH36857.1 hypothetical protein BGP89_11250 [Luteimonas sp. JM171]